MNKQVKQRKGRRKKFLTPREKTICTQMAASDNEKHRRRARALLALADGATHSEAAEAAGLKAGQMQYLMRIFLKDRLAIFPKEGVRRRSPRRAVKKPATPVEAVSATEAAAPAVMPQPEPEITEIEKGEEEKKPAAEKKKDKKKKEKGKKNKEKKAKKKKKKKKDKKSDKKSKKSKKKSGKKSKK